MHKTILLVVGDAATGERLTNRCVEARYDVEAALDVEHARRLMKILAFEVILVDTTSDGFDAREVAAELRRTAGRRPIRVVAWMDAEARHMDAPPAGFEACISRAQSDADLVAALGSAGGPVGCLCARRPLAVVRM